MKNTPTLTDYREQINTEECRWDGRKLAPTVDAYPHAEGWPVKFMEGKQWLSVKCPHCGYEWSLNKLGVPRAAPS